MHSDAQVIGKLFSFELDSQPVERMPTCVLMLTHTRSAIICSHVEGSSMKDVAMCEIQICPGILSQCQPLPTKSGERRLDNLPPPLPQVCHHLAVAV